MQQEGGVFMFTKLRSRISLQPVLEKKCSKFNDYTCSDAVSFAGNIAYLVKTEKGIQLTEDLGGDYLREQDQKQDMVIERTKNINEYDKLIESTTMSAVLGSALSYTRENIRQLAQTVNSSKSAICTTFAIAGADLLLELGEQDKYKDKIKRIEIVARQMGHGGTHCFVILNRKEGSNLQDPETWGTDTLIVDPWLASLQNPAVYTVDEYKMARWIPCTLELNYDTSNPDLAADKKQQKKQRIKLRRTCKEIIETGSIENLQVFIKENNIDLLSYKIEKGVSLFTYALKQKNSDVFFFLYSQTINPDHALRYELIKSAIRNNKMDVYLFFIKEIESLLKNSDKQGAVLINEAYKQAKITGSLIIFYELFSKALKNVSESNKETKAQIVDIIIDLTKQHKLPIKLFINLVPKELLIESKEKMQSERDGYEGLLGKLAKVKTKAPPSDEHKMQINNPPKATPLQVKPIQENKEPQKGSSIPPPPPPISGLPGFFKAKGQEKLEPWRETKRKERLKILHNFSSKYGIQIKTHKPSLINELIKQHTNAIPKIQNYLDKKDTASKSTNSTDSIYSQFTTFFLTKWGGSSGHVKSQQLSQLQEEIIKKIVAIGYLIIEIENFVMGITNNEKGFDFQDCTIDDLETLQDTLKIYRENLANYESIWDHLSKDLTASSNEIHHSAREVKVNLKLDFESIDRMIKDVQERLIEIKVSPSPDHQ
jgi:hypothetical protein